MRNLYRVKKYELDKYLEHFKQTYRFDNISRTPFSYDNFELISFVETPYGDRHLVRYTAYEYLFTANTRSFLLLSLNEKDPYLIGGNEYPEHDLYQLPPHRTDGIGLLPRFEQIMNKKGE